MNIISLSSISRTYQLDNGGSRTVLNNISLTLPSCGLVSIVGKSGSGKSTLLNMISLLDNPSSGSIIYRSENINVWSKKRKERYKNSDIGIIFQSYHLLENETAIFNIMLPALIMGKNAKEAEFAAKNLLKSINYDENLYYKKCRDLSGGEKERVAILRALINNPNIVLADEPTGALDTHNSSIIMDILKDVSKTRLVILVSHNQKLVEEYSDRIIFIKDGSIERIEDKRKIENDTKRNAEIKKIKNKKWVEKLSLSNFKRRFKRNMISILSLVIGLVSSLLIVGFATGNKTSIINRSYQQLDYGVSTFYRETSQTIPGSKMSLIQVTRPSTDEVLSQPSINDFFYVEPNCDALLSPGALIKVGERSLDDVVLSPVYSFNSETIDKNLLIQGSIPDNSFNEVVINKTAYNNLNKKMDSNPVGVNVTLHYDYEYHYYTNETKIPVIKDSFIFNKTVTIVGVVDDFDFLSTPKIYYSYTSFKDVLLETTVVNLSTYLDYKVTWYELLLDCDGSDALSSYTYRLFLKDHRNNSKLKGISESIPKPYKMETNSIVVTDTLLDLMSAATMGMEVFLVIAIIGTALIIGIISFSSYSEDKKTSAILTCLGSSKSDIFSLYLNENFAIGLISLLVSFLLAPLLSVIANNVIKKLTTFENMINIPFRYFMGMPMLLPLLIIVFTMLICIVATYVPLFFSKKISPKEELSEE